MEGTPGDLVLVWTLEIDEAAWAPRLHELTGWLTADERERMRRFVQLADQVRFAAARSMARVMLSNAGGRSPGSWRLVLTAHGRPELAAGESPSDLRFNVSHTEGLIACALAQGREVGVDVENSRRTLTYDVAERFFAPAEVSDLRRLPADEQASRFFEYWTLKESYIKARGLGLAIPLDQFAFELRAGSPPVVRIAPELEDDATTWRFLQRRPTPAHHLALAVRAQGSPPSVRIEPVTPDVIRR